MSSLALLQAMFLSLLFDYTARILR